jgi:hypothetical protein
VATSTDDPERSRRELAARTITVATAGGALLVNAWGADLPLPGDGTWGVELDTADPAEGRTASGTIELRALARAPERAAIAVGYRTRADRV